MPSIDDRLLKLVAQGVEQLGPATRWLDSLLTHIAPQTTASACTCDYFCGFFCSVPCDPPTYRVTFVCSHSSTCLFPYVCTMDCGCV